jgi:cbb3-type cytochrome oxidase cytochrome c subunit
LQVFANFSYYDLTTLNGSRRTGPDYIPIEQAQAELLQALVLSIA